MIGFVLLLVFALLAFLMYLGKIPALLALPVLAFLLTFIAGVPFYFNQYPAEMSFILKFGKSILDSQHLVSSTVISDGIPRLHVAILTVMIGGIFGYFLKAAGISESLVRKVAELAGDKPFVIALVLTLVVSFLFTTLGGLGAIILVANIYLPVLLSIGIPPLLIGSLFLMSISFGGIFNMVNWALYVDILGLSQQQIMIYALPLGVVFLVVMILFMIIEFKKARIPVPTAAVVKIFAILATICAVFVWFKATNPISPEMFLMLKWAYKALLLLLFIIPAFSRKFSWIAMLAPMIPISLVLFLGWNINPAFLLGIIFLFITTMNIRKSDSFSSRSKLLIQSSIEGIQGVAPAVAIMIGIGMVLIAVVQPPVSQSLSPLLNAVLPTSPAGYVIIFTILAPLALYRGPLNLWGMGSGLMQLIKVSGLSSMSIMAAFMSTGQIQGVCDPTNTHNVWVANQLKIELNALLRKTLPYMWVIALCGLLLGVYVK